MNARKLPLLVFAALFAASVASCGKDGQPLVPGGPEECDSSSCGDNASCVNDACACDSGFTGDPVAGCTAQQEPGTTCTDDASLCAANTSCVNDACVCKPGFKGNPLAGCVEEVEESTTCETAPSLCGANSSCVNAACVCKSGFIGDPTQGCTPLSECHKYFVTRMPRLNDLMSSENRMIDHLQVLTLGSAYELWFVDDYADFHSYPGKCPDAEVIALIEGVGTDDYLTSVDHSFENKADVARVTYEVLPADPNVVTWDPNAGWWAGPFAYWNSHYASRPFSDGHMNNSAEFIFVGRLFKQVFPGASAVPNFTAATPAQLAAKLKQINDRQQAGPGRAKNERVGFATQQDHDPMGRKLDHPGFRQYRNADTNRAGEYPISEIDALQKAGFATP